ncbi:hypothetical protein A9264_06010 [Vibrio sp. UCD-FRSSP16_10]|uniref:prepilin peptidase n=1 Tax=unclassified Vibrio TaxID=2614977 RepID=UPI0007FCEF23|nr:hypothetical protein A9264_06010 [Vibrio sp. UCD-FRSSP16_10]OBT17737.1 hypothetical protein A9260_00005 [Vibrio sp. UCD-FRSSP16_30]
MGDRNAPKYALYIIISDIRYRLISNRMVSTVFIISCYISSSWMAWSDVFSSMILISIISILIYFFKVWGGGDSKLLISLSPLFPFHIWPIVLYCIVCIGGLVTLFYWFKVRVLFVNNVERGVPYGVAILLGTNLCLGGIITGVIAI